MQIDISRAELLSACFHSVSTESTRYYLNGVSIEPFEGGGVHLVATNGHMLIAAYDSDGRAVRAAHESEKPQNVILQFDKSALKFLKPGNRVRIFGNLCDYAAPVTCEVWTRNNDPDLDSQVGVFLAKFIDGTFPDWRRVIPSDMGESTFSDCFNASYLADFAKAFKAMGARNPKLAMRQASEQGPALVQSGDSEIDSVLFGVLMPIRCNERGDYNAVMNPPRNESEGAAIAAE